MRLRITIIYLLAPRFEEYYPLILELWLALKSVYGKIIHPNTPKDGSIIKWRMGTQ